MTAPTMQLDPASKARRTWVAMLGNFKAMGAPETDPNVVACRNALAYYRVRTAITRESGQISQAGVDRLRADLAEAVAR